jgi:23S rRNA (cytidine2498-2'-O)-methyltransferase
LTEAIGKIFADVYRNAGNRIPLINSACSIGSKVLDVILVEPDQWLIGTHTATEIQHCWPGGVYPVVAPDKMVSRAYLKIAEAVAWSQLPLQPGDRVVEIGSAPGGSCQRLLDVGLEVTGVDPAEMDELLLNHPRFEHWRSKAAGMKRKMYSKFKWLTADANVAPNYTLEVVEDIVNYPTSRFQGLLLTLKLSSYELIDQVDAAAEQIRSWGFSKVKIRQLASNRRECCIAAQR